MNRNFQQQYLRAAAARLGLTQKQLAQEMGVSLQTLEKWLAPELSSNFRPMPTIAWKMVRTVLEVHSVLAKFGIPDDEDIDPARHDIRCDDDFDVSPA